MPALIRLRRSLALLMAALLAACSAKGPEPSTGVPRRIISVVPSATETLFAFGLADRIVGVGDYDVVPAEHGTRPKVGGLLNPNIEKIIELKPDLVIVYGSQNELRQKLQSVGIRMYPFTHGNVESSLDYMIRLGQEVGAEYQARGIVSRIQSALADIRDHVPAAQPTILLVHDRSSGVLGGFYSVGSRAFQNDLIEIAGGRNIFSDVDDEVVQPSLEEIIRRAPDIIIETLSSAPSKTEAARRAADWNRLSSIPAVRNGRVHIVSDDFMLVPGPRLDLAARRYEAIVWKGI